MMFNWKRPQDMPITEPTEEQIWAVIKAHDPQYAAPIQERLTWHQEMLEGRNIYGDTFTRSSRMNTFDSELPSGYDPIDWVTSLNLRHSNEAPLEQSVDHLTTGRQDILQPATDDAMTTGIVRLLGYHILHQQAKDWDPKSTFGTALAPISGYTEWARYHLRMHHSILKKAGVYQAIYASLFDYSRLPFTWIRSIAEHWDKTTNTCWFGVHELTITLTDIQDIASLPILGTPYEECIPPDHELFERRNADGQRKGTFIYPNRLHRALDHYKRLSNNQKGRRKRRGAVTLDAWTESFMQKSICSSQYARLSDPFAIEGHVSETSFTERFEPEGGIDARHILASHIDNDLSLVAFIATWLCYFVFPGKNRLFRPSTLLMASLISKGERIALAPATLAYLYHGLGQVSVMTDSRKYDVEAPWHFLHGWIHAHISGGFSCLEMPQYFKEHRYPIIMQLSKATAAIGISQIRTFMFAPEHMTDRFQIIHKSQMQSLSIQNFNQHFEDTIVKGNVPLLLSKPAYRNIAEHFIAMRPSWLCYRRHESVILKEYHPNRVARQFGFVQATPSYGLPQVPGVDNVRSLSTLSLSIRLNAASMAWAFIFRLGTGSRFYIAPRQINTGVSHFWLKWIRHTFSSFLEMGFRIYSHRLHKSKHTSRMPIIEEASGKGDSYKRYRDQSPVQTNYQPPACSERNIKRSRSVTSFDSQIPIHDKPSVPIEMIESSGYTCSPFNDYDKVIISSPTSIHKSSTASKEQSISKSLENLDTPRQSTGTSTMLPTSFDNELGFDEIIKEDIVNNIDQSILESSSELELSCFVSQIQMRKASSSRSHLAKSQSLAIVAMRELLLSIKMESLPEISVFCDEANSLLNYAAVTGLEANELQHWESILREVEFRLFLIQNAQDDESLEERVTAEVVFKSISEKATLARNNLQKKLKSSQECEVKISEAETEALNISTELEDLRLKIQYLTQKKEAVDQAITTMKMEYSKMETQVSELKQISFPLDCELEAASLSLQIAQEKHEHKVAQIDVAKAFIKELQTKHM